MIMSWYFIPWTIQYLLGGLIAVLITSLVFKKNPKNLAYQRFLLFGICTFVWMFAVFFARNAPSASISFQIYRLIQFCFMLSLPLLLLTLISLQKTNRIFLLTLVPGLFIGLLISVLALYNVAWGKYGWSYSISPIASIIGFPILFGYFIGIIATGSFLMKKSMHHSLAMKYKLIVIGCILYFVPLTITNVLMWSQSETPPFGGFLLTIEFLFIAYAISLPLDKIEIIKPTKLSESYTSVLNSLEDEIPGKELGYSGLKFTDYINAMGLTNMVAFREGKLVFDTATFAEEEIGDVADSVLRALKELPELKETIALYIPLFVETYKTLRLISKNDAERWLEQMLHSHGGFFYQQGISDALPDEITATTIFKEMQQLYHSSKAELEVRVKERTRELARALEFSESIVDTVPDSLLVIDTNLRIKSANRSFYEKFQTEPEKVMGRSIADVLGDEGDGKLSNELGKVFEPGEMLVNFEWHHQSEKLGARIFNVAARGIAIAEEGLVVLEEITERKRAEDQITASLKEKELLLQEIHHRVKNNMQVISSLLMLQSRQVKNEKALEILRDSQNRIRSMALVHEKLYHSENLSMIDFADYIRSLTSHLFSTYRVNAAEIKLNIEIKGVLLDINTAIPCGLIINELVSNSLKHAFPDGKRGEIKIVMHEADEDEVELMVSDTGIGFPEDLDFRNTESLGMQLVVSLVEEQLDGTIELDRSGGTAFTITLKKQTGHKRWV